MVRWDKNQAKVFYGQWVNFAEYNKDSGLVITEDSEFENNLLIKARQKDKNGKILSTYNYKHDDKGNMIEITVIEFTPTGEKKTITKDTYEEVDHNGNWLKRTFWDEDGKALKVEKREFIYRK